MAGGEPPIGILAGGGRLPSEVAAEIVASGRQTHIVAIEGEADRAIEAFAHTWVNWGGIGAMLRALRGAGCRELVIVGGVRRPDIRAVRPDRGFWMSLPAILKLITAGGDDGVLRRVVRFFEGHGLTVRGVHDVAPTLLAPMGPLGTHAPRAADQADARTGFALISALSACDVGQAAVIAGGQVIAIEAAEGTDAMLGRLADRGRAPGAAEARSGVLVKRPKPGQELRVDLPAIGPHTVRLAQAAGLSGLALEAGLVLLVERQEIVRAADAGGLFVVGIAAGSAAHPAVPGSGRVDVAARLEPLGRRRPRPQERRDVGRCLEVLRVLAPFGTGGAVAAVRGHVLAIEAGEGVPAMLARVGRWRQWGDAGSSRRRGALVVRGAPADAKSVVAAAAAAGLAGVAVTRGEGLSRLRAAAEQADIFAVRISAGDARHAAAEPGPAAPAIGRELRLFLVAGEHSGDALGAKLMAAVTARCRRQVRYAGVGGPAMAAQGLASAFPIADVAVMGPLSILPRLPRIVTRVYRAVDAAVAADPDAVVIIDAPEFTHQIARRIRRRRPDIPIIDYVSPSVWAWRPGRASPMTRYIDHVLALLPFEPEVLRRLGGPPTSYVGHPLIERLDWLRALDPAPLAERLQLTADRPVLVVLPGSRASEVARLMGPFGGAVDLLRDRGGAPQVIIPIVPHLRWHIETLLKTWGVRTHLIEGEEDKFRAFKLADAALAASGTATLELGLAGTPMVVAYRVDALAAPLRFLVRAPSIVLANLVLGENVFPEFIQEACRPDLLADAAAPLLGDTPERRRQLSGLARIAERMRLAAGTPSEAAAEIVLRYAERGRTELGP